VSGATSPAALAVTGLVIVVMVLGPRIRRTLPVSLIAVAVATVVAEAAHLNIARIGHLPGSFPAPALPSLAPSRVSELFGPALAVAALAALESLLSAKVADGMADSPSHD